MDGNTLMTVDEFTKYAEFIKQNNMVNPDWFKIFVYYIML